VVDGPGTALRGVLASNEVHSREAIFRSRDADAVQFPHLQPWIDQRVSGGIAGGGLGGLGEWLRNGEGCVVP